MPIFQPLRSDSQRIGTIPRLMEPPWGKRKKLWLIRLNAAAKATKIIISARIFVENLGL